MSITIFGSFWIGFFHHTVGVVKNQEFDGVHPARITQRFSQIISALVVERCKPQKKYALTAANPGRLIQSSGHGEFITGH